METEVTAARRSIGAKRNPDSEVAILDAAARVLARNGYAGFSIEAVAREARAGKPTIYKWWPSKAALLLGVYQRQKREVVYPGEGPIEDDIFRFLVSMLKQWRETPTGDIFRSIVAEAQSDPVARQALADYSEERRKHSGQIIAKAQLRGEVRSEIVPTLIAELIGSYAWIRLLTGRLDADVDELRQVAGCIAAGIKA